MALVVGQGRVGEGRQEEEEGEEKEEEEEEEGEEEEEEEEGGGGEEGSSYLKSNNPTPDGWGKKQFISSCCSGSTERLPSGSKNET